MGWLSRKRSQGPGRSTATAHPWQGLFDRIEAQPASLQRAIAQRLLAWMAPFGDLDPAVVSPGEFEDLSTRARSSLDSQDRGTAGAVAARLRVLLRLEDEDAEEPAGPGFFTFYTLAEMSYALGLLTGEWPRPMQCLAGNFLDTLGFVDDDIGTDLHRAGMNALAIMVDGHEPTDLGPACREAAHQLARRR